MSESDRVQYKFMIPASLKAKLEDAAHERRRSLSAEIIARLETTFLADHIAEREEDLSLKLKALEADLVTFMLSQGRDPLEIRRMWVDEAKRLREDSPDKGRRKLRLDDPSD